MHKRDWEGSGILSTWSMGFACLADEVPAPLLLVKQQTRKQYKYNAQSHGWRLKLDVCAYDVWGFPFKWSTLQRFCKLKLHFESKRNAYALLPLFTQENLVKHENRLHIQIPCIFLIILDILFAIFGVRMNFPWISKV